MKKELLRSLLITFVIATIFGLAMYYSEKPKDDNIEVQKVQLVFLDEQLKDLSIENVWFWLNYFEVKNPEIVLSQAVLESGWNLDSNRAIKLNNIFGFQNKAPLSFGHWIGCVVYYKQWQDSFYPGGDYYKFLHDFGYAEDTLYIQKLKSVYKILDKTNIFQPIDFYEYENI